MTPGSYCICSKGAFLTSLTSQDGGKAYMLLSVSLIPEEKEDMKRVKRRNEHLGSQLSFSG